MNATGTQNPFAPPRALVEDTVDSQGDMVEATRGSRFAAVLIDSVGPIVIIGFTLAAVAIPAYSRYKAKAAGGVPGADTGAGMAIVAVVLVLAMLAYFVYSAVLVYRYGQTVGKRVMGIRVVRSDGTRVAFGRFIFLRWLPLFVLGMIPYIGYVVGLLDSLLVFRDSRQCLHDNIADTKVVTAATSEAATLAGSSGAHLRTIAAF